jgi:hypothetical protein
MPVATYRQFPSERKGLFAQQHGAAPGMPRRPRAHDQIRRACMSSLDQTHQQDPISFHLPSEAVEQALQNLGVSRS